MELKARLLKPGLNLCCFAHGRCWDLNKLNLVDLEEFDVKIDGH